MNHIVFRLPLRSRILIVASVVVVGGGIIGATTASYKGADSIVVPIVFVAVVATLGYRQFGLAVIVQGDELVVRNYWITHRIPREHIRGFASGRPSMGAGRTILVNTGMSSVPLDALVVWPQSRSAAYRRENALAMLSEWANLG